MKLKNCQYCKQDQPLSNYTSSQARFCNNCRTIRRLKQLNDMQSRSIDKVKSKKPKKVVITSLADLKKKAQRVFNAWIRERDKYLPCISCGVTESKSWQAGHFWAMGSNGSLRYNELNCHKQCVGCNMFKSGNLLEYRFGLIKKIGTEKLDWLDNNRHETKKWTREELEAIIEKYK